MSSSEAVDPACWVDEHGDALFRYALIQLGERELAEACVQETFLAALEGRRSFRGRSAERTWLIGILKHKICDHFRRRRREVPVEPEETADLAFTADGYWARPPRRWSGSAEGLLERQEFREVLQACVRGLPQRLAEAYCLREIHELRSEDICKVLGVSATNLWTLLHRARVRLRQCLEERWFRRGEEPR